MASLKGTGPELEPGSTRRPRSSVEYNIKALTYQTRAPSEPNLKKSKPRAPTSGSRSLHHASAQSTHKARKWMTQKHQAQPERRRVEGLLRKYKKPPERALERASGFDDDDDSPASPRRVEEGNADLIDAFVQGLVQHFAPTESRPKKAETSIQMEYILQTVRKAGEPTPGRVKKSIVSSALNYKLFSFPKQRNIEWATGRSKAWKFSKDIDVTALLMQMTGKMAQTPCTRCVDGRGQWKNCVLIPPGTDNTRIYGCANCVYHGKQTYCSYKLWGRKGPKKPASGHVQEHKETVRDFHQGRISVPEVESIIEDDEPPAANDADPVGSKQALSHQVDGRRRSTRPSAANSREATGVEETVTSLVAVGRPGELLSMEPWERAPGQIRSRIPDKAENIAFSKSYLAAGHEVQACREATFRIEVVRSGHNHKVEAQSNVTRLCSIAAGKVRVKVAGEAPFIIGPHGMFRITPNSSCLIESEVYDDVVLHITSIRAEED